MTEDELLQEFVREEQTPEELRISVQVITWRGPHTPKAEWILWRTVSGILEEEELAGRRAELLRDKRYFQLCAECGEGNPSGWMDGPDLCQLCAEENHGVVY